MAKRVLQGLLVAALLAGLSGLASADEGDAAVSEGAKIDKKAVEAAVKKGCDWLKKQQKSDGSWTGTGKYDVYYPYSSTAFVLYTLLKGTEGPDSDCVKNGFAYLKKNDFPGVYGVSALILALCALYEPPEPEEEEEKAEEGKPAKKTGTTVYEPREKQARKRFKKKAPPWVNDWLKRAVAWLVSKQATNVWRYPSNRVGDYGKQMGVGGNEDASNTQYAMLALHAAGRLGVKAPVKVYEKVAEYFIIHQEKDGPEVKPPFPVPAADLPISKLKKLEKEILKKLREEAKEAEKMGLPPPDVKKIGPRTTTEIAKRDPYKEFGGELSPMKARGWSYFPFKTDVPVPWMTQPTGSMTTSGVAALIICKARLEGTGWHGKNKKKLRRAIRDGMAWIAHNFTVTENPKLDVWKYYYLYGLERSGVLALTRKIGKHFWYEEGAKHILDTQGSDGSWPGGSGGGGGTVQGFEYGPTWPTCFAILFLKRATAPVVDLPPVLKPTYTGEGIIDPNKKKK